MAEPEAKLTISFKAMQRCRTTLEDFMQSYLPYMGLQYPKDMWQHFDVLAWVEATIYQLDEDNEAMAKQGIADPHRQLLGESVVHDVLSSLGLLDDSVDELLCQGDKYWMGERELCAAMLAHSQQQQQQEGTQCTSLQHSASQKQPMETSSCVVAQRTHTEQQGQGIVAAQGHDSSAAVVRPPAGQALRDLQPACPFTLEQVITVHQAKSFDYRLLHVLLRKLARVPPDPLVMDFLLVDELLVDIGDDLVDYEDDVEANSFNILRAYVHLYGEHAPLKLVERISELEELHGRLLQELPPALQQHYWSRHMEASQEGQGAGRWAFPPLILDEAEFRRSLQSSSSSSGDESSDGESSQ